MKRTLFTAVFCIALLAGGALFLSEAAKAQEDVISALLELPAPPPPNPLMPPAPAARDRSFYDQTKPPPDNAPIEDLIEYWTNVGADFRDLKYQVFPSSAVVSRLLAEAQKDPDLGFNLMKSLGGSEDGIRFIKNLYDRQASGGSLDEHEIEGMRTWLTYNSPHFADVLERRASRVTDVGEYLSHHDELLALGRQDWNRAGPIVNRLYNDPAQPNSRVAALWALYRRALDTDSIGDTDRYRDELKAIVEDRSATPAMRDLAFDALSKEKTWPGRDEWYLTLLADETLADLQINGSSFTGLTTIVYHSPRLHFKDAMIELAGGNNQVVRNAAVRNLVLMLSENDEEIVKALLPWLSDPKWAQPPSSSGGRSQLVGALATIEMPESVPGLIAMLDEKETRIDYSGMESGTNTNSNAAWGAANTLASAANAAARVGNTAGIPNSNSLRIQEYFPHRSSAIRALAKQADPRAVPALRRLLNQVESYERMLLVDAILASDGFAVSEQVDGLEHYVRELSKAQADIGAAVEKELGFPITEATDMLDLSPEDRERVYELVTKLVQSQAQNYDKQDLNSLVGAMVAVKKDHSDMVIRAVLDRMERLQRREPATAKQLRTVLLNWNGQAINSLIMRDLQAGKADVESIVKLLSKRKEIREKQPGEAFELRSGPPIASGTSACLLEDPMGYQTALSAGGEVAAAMLACARLVRVELPIPTVAEFLRASDKRLAKAAELYLESEDSAEARRIVLSLYPGKFKVLGATSFFSGSSRTNWSVTQLSELFVSVTQRSLALTSLARSQGVGPAEEPSIKLETLQKELTDDPELLGIYSYGSNVIRIRRDGVNYSHLEDEARYRERAISTEEFDHLRQYLTQHSVDELKPFLSCVQFCPTRELIMVGRAGGRRVYAETVTVPEFFVGLDEYFAEIRNQPMALKYLASRDIPGLEVIFADENLTAETVVKENGELRVLTTDRAARERSLKEYNQDYLKIVRQFDGDRTDHDEFDSEIPVSPTAQDGDEEADEAASYAAYHKRLQELRDKRAFDGVAWYNVSGGRATSVTAPPAGIDLPAPVDMFEAKATTETWKARGSGVELRLGDSGLFKLARNKMTQLRTGYYHSLVMSSNARWALAYRENDTGSGLVRVDVNGQRDFEVQLPEDVWATPVTYITAVNRFLLRSGNQYSHYYEDHEGEAESILPRTNSQQRSTFWLLEPETGRVQTVPGEIRPISHQTFRPLQQAAKPHEFWAAIPDKGREQTVIGIYDSRMFGFKPVLTLPKLLFDSMDLWVDEAERKAYFVYKGHILAINLPK